MKITVNGEIKDIGSHKITPSLEDVINQLGYHPKAIVVEYNGEILPPSNWCNQRIKDEDSLEIVTIVGGGS